MSDPNKLIIYNHPPKTGGTSLGTVLANAMMKRGQRTIRVELEDSWMVRKDKMDEALGDATVGMISGHFIGDMVDDVVRSHSRLPEVWTTWRDPYGLLKSYWSYYRLPERRSHQVVPLNVQIKRWKECVEAITEAANPLDYVLNVDVDLLPHVVHEATIDTADRVLDWCGDTDGCLNMIRSVTGLDVEAPDPERLNASPPVDHDAEDLFRGLLSAIGADDDGGTGKVTWIVGKGPGLDIHSAPCDGSGVISLNGAFPDSSRPRVNVCSDAREYEKVKHGRWLALGPDQLAEMLPGERWEFSSGAAMHVAAGIGARFIVLNGVGCGEGYHPIFPGRPGCRDQALRVWQELREKAAKLGLRVFMRDVSCFPV